LPHDPERRAEGPEAADAPAPAGALSKLLQHLASDDVPEGTAPALWPGSVVGRFELLREIGRGGFGVVYEARDRQLGRLVAFKALRPGTAVRARRGDEWLLREAEAAAQLAHPNIVTFYDAGRADSGPYLIFELLEGEDLRERLGRGPLQVREAIRIAIEIARALAHAHAASVVHCDLKPANVFLSERGAVKVLDFGVARVFGESRLGSAGTPAYMAPEQWRGEEEDARADVFALGVMLFEMVSGSVPFEVSHDRSGALDPGTAPPLHAPGAPEKLAAFVAAALRKDRAGRPRDGQAALEALLGVERELQRAEQRSGGRSRKLRWLAALTVGLALAAVASLFALRLRDAPSPERITVAVADFANETGDPELDGLSGLLITSLEQSRRLTVLTRARMLDILDQLGKDGVQRIDEPLAREVGRHVGARALMFASIRRFDAVYYVEMKALDPVGDSYLFTVQEQANGKASIPDVIDRVSERARRALRESAEDVRASEVKVADAVTGNLEAYHHYFLGIQCEEGPDFPFDCAQHFRRALAIDPTFALAQYRLAVEADFGAVSTSDQQAAFDAALRHLDRFPMKERLTALAWKAHVDGDDAAAVRMYRKLASDHPQDKYISYLAGDLHFHRDEYAEAIVWFEKTLELDPRNGEALFHLLEALAAVGRGDETIPLAKRFAEEHPGPTAWLALATAFANSGQLAPAIEWMRRAAEEPLDIAHWGLGALLMVAGDYEGAERAFQEMRSDAGQLRNDAGLCDACGRAGIAMVQAYQGKRREALRTLDAIPGALGPGAPLNVFHKFRIQYAMGGGRLDIAPSVRVVPWSRTLAAQLAYLGDLETSAEAGRTLVPGSPYDRLYRAVVDWRRGDASGAADRIAELMRQSPWVRYGAWFQAEALFEAGRYAEAVTALGRFQRTVYEPEGMMYRSGAYPKSLYLLARSYEELGRREEARAEIRKLLAMWKDADPDLPLLAEARALRTRLETDGERAR
jgi:serine/threonine protein kinase/tetratricopeptide (TPR) repeat protein